jgi:hypothetical protein
MFCFAGSLRFGLKINEVPHLARVTACFAVWLTGAELFQLILAARYSFPAPEWTNVSDSAKDFIRKLLVVQSEKRMTARYDGATVPR